MINETPASFRNKIEQGILAMRIINMISEEAFNNLNNIVETTWKNGAFEKAFNEVQSRFVKLEDLDQKEEV